METRRSASARTSSRSAEWIFPGGGSVVVENGYAYVGHMDPPHGTSIIDVRDPKNPKVVAHLEIPEGLHSHKVRVSGDLMLINYERYKAKQELDVRP